MFQWKFISWIIFELVRKLYLITTLIINIKISINQKLFHEIILRIKKVIGQLLYSNLPTKKYSNTSSWHFSYNIIYTACGIMIFISPESYDAKLSNKSNINELREVFMEIWTILSILMNHWNIFLAHCIFITRAMWQQE